MKTTGLSLSKADLERYDIRDARGAVVGQVYRAGVGWNAYTRAPPLTGEYTGLGRGGTPEEALASLRPPRFRTPGKE
jgi:hypothetical protein